MLGKLPRDEVRVVVRHLLAGCPKCGDVTRQLWSLGDRVPPERGAPSKRRSRRARRAVKAL